MKRSILDLLSQRTDISSIKEDLVPWLCRTQYRKATRRQYGSTLVKQTGNPQTLALSHSTVQPPAPSGVALRRSGRAGDEEATNDLESELMSPQSPPTSSAPTSQPASPRIHAALMGLDGSSKSGTGDVDIRCTYVVHRLDSGVAIRANTLKTYFDANRLVSLFVLTICKRCTGPSIFGDSASRRDHTSHPFINLQQRQHPPTSHPTQPHLLLQNN